jgi:AraC-like DNA-binding protein
MPERALTVVAGVVARMVQVATDCGLDRAALLAEIGLDPGALADRDNRLPLATVLRVWALLHERFPDRALALDWVRSWKPTDLGVIGYVVAQVSTVGEAMEAVARYGQLIDESQSTRLRRGSPTSRLEYGLAPVVLATEHAAETIMASLVHFIRGIVGESFVPIAVRLPHRASRRAPVLERYFGCPVLHEAGEISTEFPTELLDRPMPGADPALAGYLKSQAETLAGRLAARDVVSQECARRIAEGLGRGEPAQTDVARQMGMSERTLQRRLAAEGTTFNELLEDARRTMAVSYLADRKLAAYEVSFLLGYSEPATFFRAFKRWTGKTPQQYRATALDA